MNTARIGSIAAILGMLAIFLGPATGAGQPYVEGERLDFDLADCDGGRVTASDERFSGKVLLVDLWGTWCPPCLSEIPTFVDLQNRYAPRGLVIVAIAFEGEEDPVQRCELVQKFSKDYGINYLVLDGGHTSHFEAALPMVKNVRGFPVEIIIDRDGKVVESRNGYGYKKRWARRLEQKLAELLEPSSPE